LFSQLKNETGNKYAQNFVLDIIRAASKKAVYLFRGDFSFGTNIFYKYVDVTWLSSTNVIFVFNRYILILPKP